MNQPKRRGRPPKSAYMLGVPLTTMSPGIEGLLPWNDFVEYVRGNGDWVVRAAYPGRDGQVIDTIWRGVPVIDDVSPKVMDANSNWESV